MTLCNCCFAQCYEVTTAHCLLFVNLDGCSFFRGTACYYLRLCGICCRRFNAAYARFALRSAERLHCSVGVLFSGNNLLSSVDQRYLIFGHKIRTSVVGRELDLWHSLGFLRCSKRAKCLLCGWVHIMNLLWLNQFLSVTVCCVRV